MENEEYKGLFLSEAREHIDSLNNCLVVLEKQPGNQDIINDIFRSFHTLKGNSATMGYEKFSKVAHRLEDLLDRVRNNKLKVDKKIMDILFLGCDVLDGGLQAIDESVPESLDIDSIMDNLESVIPSETTEKKEEKALTDNIEFTNKEEDLIKKQGIKKEDVKRAVIEFEDHPLKGPKALTVIKAIEGDKDTTIVRINPEKKDIKQNKMGVNLEIIFFSKNSGKIEEIIKKVSKIKDHRIFGHDESYLSHKKEVKKSRMMSDHSEELKKVQDVRIDIKRLDSLMDMVGELLIYKMRLENINQSLKSKDLGEITKFISILTEKIQNEVIEERMIPLGSVFSRFPRIVRDLSTEEGKEIDFIMEGEDNKLDRTVIDKITDPLVHLVRNSVDHGIEEVEKRAASGKDKKGTIRLSAKREKNNVLIELEDDGGGIDTEKIRQVALQKGIATPEEIKSMDEQKLQQLIFVPGFSTNEKITEVSGRGVGMDVVETNVRAAGGKVLVSSKKGLGTKVKMELPLTMAIITVLIVDVNKEKYAIPLNNVSETLKIYKKDIKTFQTNETFILRGEDIPLLRLRSLVGVDTLDNEEMIVIIVESSYKKVGIVIDTIDAQQQILLKDIDETLKKVKGIAGGTILGDGKVCFILDIETLLGLNEA